MRFSHVIAHGHVSIMFDAKPPDDVRAVLKANGFRWNPAEGFWWRRAVKGAADFLAALDRKCNPGRPDGACWKCQSPNGHFRACGAATPVYCDDCWKTLNTPDATDLAYEEACARACGL